MNALRLCARTVAQAFGRRAFGRRAFGRRKKRTRPWDLGSMEEKFTAIHRENTWRHCESVSGQGSSLRQTEAIRRELPGLLRQIGARSLLDVPCGDYNWMQQVDLDDCVYLGADIVETIVEANDRRFGHSRRRFLRLDLTRDELPPADLVLCRDCLVHFCFADAHQAIENIVRSGSTYLATTTFMAPRENREIATGQWRPLNLREPPFGLPEPILAIHEDCPKKGYADKHLGVWRIADLRLARAAAGPLA